MTSGQYCPEKMLQQETLRKILEFTLATLGLNSKVYLFYWGCHWQYSILTHAIFSLGAFKWKYPSTGPEANKPVEEPYPYIHMYLLRGIFPVTQSRIVGQPVCAKCSQLLVSFTTHSFVRLGLDRFKKHFKSQVDIYVSMYVCLVL